MSQRIEALTTGQKAFHCPQCGVHAHHDWFRLSYWQDRLEQYFNMDDWQAAEYAN